MQCLECGNEVANLDNRHLLRCCSLTLQEYAIRHHLPLDLLIDRALINQAPLAWLEYRTARTIWIISSFIALTATVLVV